MWIERLIEPVLRRAFDQFPAVVLTGTRQTGKTSLCRRVVPNADYVSFDIPSHAEQARLAPQRFLAEHREPLILDEIQYVPDLLRHLKAVIDRDRRPGRFLMTGSQSFPLMADVSESLAGRCAVLTLPTLGITEPLAAKILPEDRWQQFLWRSGFPELWQRPELDRELWLGSYVATYLERDVRNVLRVGNLRDFDRFLRAAAARAGQLLSLTEIARDVGVAPNTAKAWLSVLEASRQVFLLPPYHRNAGKRLIKTPKLYFADVGLLVYLLGFRTWADVPSSPMWGSIWENAVIAEIRKLLENRAVRLPLCFWRTTAGEEADLLIELGANVFLAVECKAAATIEPRDVKGLAAFRELYGAPSLRRGWVACGADEAYPLAPDGVFEARPLVGVGSILAGVEREIAGDANVVGENR